MQALRRLLREPLAHFLALGVVLFLVYGRVSDRPGGDRRIVVSQAQVDALADEYTRLWGRAPSGEELSGLAESWVRDEILYREGVRLGLDRDDAVIRRRVRQKLEIIAEEELTRGEPSDAELSSYLASNAERFAHPARIAFEQVLLDPAATGPDSARVVDVARGALARGADPTRVGRATMLPAQMRDVALDVVARDFGEEFARRLAGLPVNAWAGPVRSGFGVHLVRVTARTPGALPSLGDVRADVLREWENARRERAMAGSYRKLRESYDVELPATLPVARVPRS